MAGIEIVHEICDVEVLDPERQYWQGTPVTAEPILVRHVARSTRRGETLRPLLDAPPHASYYLDDRNELVARLHGRGDRTGATMRPIRPGFEYELSYEDLPGEPDEASLHDRTIFGLALNARGTGLLCHACGFVLGDGRGVLCPGVSETGKSTLARLLVELGVEVLSDDRVAVMRDGPGFRLWGTPWPGDARICGTGSGSLAVLGLIGRGESVRMARAGAIAAIERLANTVIMSWWNRPSTERALQAFDEIVGATEVVSLQYPATTDAVSAILTALRRNGEN